ncbi:MAG: hypothetical protein CRN43_01795 [Candidatus Nephrothrix sp. EaCA]|nr:MAG: hypothetical protein CRN43_01795 [Candidatus Nephrothrix sp. EaCA]
MIPLFPIGLGCMKITKIHLSNFKRFSDLLIENIPPHSKLVLMIGANGSGKSSVFDAFGFCDGAIKRDISIREEEFLNYFKKKNDQPVSVKINFDNDLSIALSDSQYYDAAKNLPPHSFYGRTSLRQVPKLTRTSLGQSGRISFENDSDRPKLSIERDNRFENDVERITQMIYRDVFQSNQSSEQIRKKYIHQINASLQNIFGNENGTKLSLVEFIPPGDGRTAAINFSKGESAIHYNYLSAGEKAVFNLLMNLMSRVSLYPDTVYYIDEIDLHLNTALQFSLLKEITENLIPDNCQLWTASHSLGFIEYAKQTETASIIDFGNLDFDLPRILSPEAKDNPDIYEIAVGKSILPSLFKGKRIFFVENQDKNYFASVDILNTVFVSDNDRNSVFHKVRTSNYCGIIDRDFLSDDDILQIRRHYPNLFVLRYYSIENCLYHPDNLDEYYSSKGLPFNKEEYISQLTEAKNLCKDSIALQLALKRTEYPFFREPEYSESPLQKRFKNEKQNVEQSAAIARNLNSDDFETYYKSLPMKKYCTQLRQRQHIPKSELSKTKWFEKNLDDLIRIGLQDYKILGHERLGGCPLPN